MALTWLTLAARIRNFKIGAFGTLGLAILAAVLGVVARSGWVLAMLPSIFMCGYVFLYRDHLLASSWEERVLAIWGEPGFSMGIFAHAVASHPHPLKNTLRAMAGTLPENGDYSLPAPPVIRMHRVLSALRCSLYEIRLYRAAALGIFLASLPIAGWLSLRLGMPRAWYALPTMALIPMAASALSRQAWYVWLRRTEASLASTEEAAADLAGAMEDLDWSHIPSRWRMKFTVAVLGRQSLPC
ncbi:MAG: hypothetical protein ABIW76_21090 [Fibrobacteria bacterium]